MDLLTFSELRGKKRGWWIAFFIFVTALMTGASLTFYEFDLGQIRPAGETLGRYEMLLVCAALLLTFFVPFALFLYYSCRKLLVSWKLAILAFFSGWFIASSFVVPVNQAGISLLQNLASKSFATVWAPSIVGPIVEETMKLLVVICILALLGRHGREQYLITGMSVGMGFQIGEDLSDIIQTLKGGHHAYVTAISFTMNQRVATSLGSHWCYTGVAAVGIYLIFRQKRRKEGILLLLAAYLDHSLFNMGFLHNSLMLALITGFILVIMFYVYMKTCFEFRARQSGERGMQA